VHSGANKNGNLATNLKNLSQLIGVLYWCDSSAKILLRSWTACDLNLKLKFKNIQLNINIFSHAFCA